MGEEGTLAERIEAAQPGDIIILPTAPKELTACKKCKHCYIKPCYIQGWSGQPIPHCSAVKNEYAQFDFYEGKHPDALCIEINDKGHCPHFDPA